MRNDVHPFTRIRLWVWACLLFWAAVVIAIVRALW